MVSRARVRLIITILAATSVEARAVRKYAKNTVRVVEAGIALSKQHRFDGIVISCGLAGGLRADLPTGTVLIPHQVYRADGTSIECDPEIVQQLTKAARDLGFDPVHDPIVTSQTLVHGEARKELASHGYAGVDMESGLIEAQKIGCVRVILDTQQREISPAWLHPWSVIVHPSALRDLPFLLREAPRCADIAARIAVCASE